MKRFKTYLETKEVEKKENNKVVIIKSTVKARSKLNDKIWAFDNKISDIVYRLNDGYCDDKVYTGKAVCQEGDTFDPKLGHILAARRAEAKGLKDKLSCVGELRSVLEEYLQMVNDMEDALDYKLGKVGLDIVSLSRTGKTLSQLRKGSENDE